MRNVKLYENDKKSRNPYFIGILSAIYSGTGECEVELVSQSLFYWNPFCNNIEPLDIYNLKESQSLFYWNPFCNKREKNSSIYHTWRSQSLFYWNPFCNLLNIMLNLRNNYVAILILLESFLQ